MKQKFSLICSLFGLVVFVLGVPACNFPGLGASSTTSTTKPPGGTTAVANTALAASTFPLPDPGTIFQPPPIVLIPKSSVQISGESFDVYQVPGDRLRILCKQPCAFDERMMDALSAIYKVTAQAVVRTAGFDVLDKFSILDIHLDRDNVCTQFEGELGLTTSYPDNPDSIVICLYLTAPEYQDSLQSGTTTSFTPEGAIRSGGLGVFAHEYAHALLFGRFASSHDFVYPIEYVTFNPDDVMYYGDLCQSLYQNNSPLSYQLCLKYGFTFQQMIQSMLEINQLYEDGFGNLQGGMVGYAQYQAILQHLLGSDVTQTFTDTGYQKVLAEEGKPAYTLPYAGESCSYRAQIVSDVTVPLGTTLDFQSPFEKSWRIKNTGTCNWQGVQLIFTRGEPMTASMVVPVPDTVSGAEVDVSIPMTAPAEEGVHVGEWRLRNASSEDFGPIINLMLYTRQGCSLPPEPSFFQAEPSTIGPGALALLMWGQVTNTDNVEIVGLGKVDPNGNHLLVQPEQTTTYILQANCGSQVSTMQATVTVDTSFPRFAVTNANATADPAQFDGSCGNGLKIHFTGEFTSNGPGAVVFQWTRSDGSTSKPHFSISDKTGVNTIQEDWSFWGSAKGWMEMQILAPLESDPARADFFISCTP